MTNRIFSIFSDKESPEMKYILYRDIITSFRQHRFYLGEENSLNLFTTNFKEAKRMSKEEAISIQSEHPAVNLKILETT